MDKKRIFCNKCNGRTNHEVIDKETNYTYFDDESNYLEEIQHKIVLKCMGCGEYTIEEIHTGPVYQIGPDQYENYYFYTPRRTENLMKIERIDNLPKSLEKLRRQVINNLNDGSIILSTIGARAMLEFYLKDKYSYSGTYSLKTMIDMTEDFTPVMKEGFNQIRIHGNSSVHSIKEIDVSTLKIVLDMLDQLLIMGYERSRAEIIEGLSSTLKKSQE